MDGTVKDYFLSYIPEYCDATFLEGLDILYYTL